MKVENSDLSWLLNVSNDLRRLHGDDPLEDLPLSTPNEVNACLIANAFNYDCEVFPTRHFDKWDKSRPDSYAIKFRSEDDAKLYLKTIGLEDTDEHILEYVNEWAGNSYYCPLTDDLNRIALNFDAGDYPEYDEYSEINDPDAYVEDDDLYDDDEL